MPTLLSRCILVAGIISCGIHPSFGQIISGSGTVKLSGPASKENAARAEIAAQKNLRKELLLWLSETEEISIDTTSTVQNLAFNMFLDSCRTSAKSETSFRGKQLTLTYLLTSEVVREKIASFNTAVDARALQAWNSLKEASGSSDIRSSYQAGFTALFFSLAHLGPPVATPDGGGIDFTDDIRQTLQQLFDKMTVKSTGMILAGKTGLSIENPPSINILFDSLAVPGIMYTGRLQNGTIIFSAPSNEDGNIPIDNFKIPFVPNGALLDIGPNPAHIIGATGFLNPADFGIQLRKSQVQAFIFKIIKPVYTLQYKAAAVNNIDLPPEFADVARVKKFLRDSCFLKEKSGSEKTDLEITINTQVSSYTYDETEEIAITVSSQIIVNGLLLTPPRTNKSQMKFEKRYDAYTTPPYGLYFWEANGKLREAIKGTIAGL